MFAIHKRAARELKRKFESLSASQREDLRQIESAQAEAAAFARQTQLSAERELVDRIIADVSQKLLDSRRKGSVIVLTMTGSEVWKSHDDCGSEILGVRPSAVVASYLAQFFREAGRVVTIRNRSSSRNGREDYVLMAA
ncbi:MAG: hypothetical protein EKK48_18980 [Candidatus Melainabacteria bacterium]|nr:MAG: hypothetical protein EKK48_18980 [Candidatus Melainabacteria bacterium]